MTRKGSAGRSLRRAAVYCIAIGVGAVAAAAQEVPYGGETVTLSGPDGRAIVADRYDGPGEGRVVVLFHQAGSSARGEYSFLVPNLLALGFDVLAPDLVGGGDDFGAPNRTVGHAPEPPGFTFCDALDHVAAVLDHARGWKPEARLIPWGSSYTASLVVHAAAADSTAIERILAFSPASGGSMAPCAAAAALPELHVPVLFIRPEQEAASPEVQARFEMYRATGHETLVAAPGTHGSSTLNPHRVEGDPSATWEAVRSFLLRPR